MPEQIIRLREELAEQIRALQEIKTTCDIVWV